MVLRNLLTRICKKASKKKCEPYRGKPGNKRRKLDEASYYFNCMVLNEHQTGLFQFNYSAFLTAARSVLQYSHEEADPDCNHNAKPGALKWYEKAVAKSPVIKFGRDERDENIHWAPVIPNAHALIAIKEPMPIKESGLAILRGEARVRTIPIGAEVEVGTPLTMELSYKYTSERWKGDENVLEVCRLYLDELKALVKDGVSQGYITW